MKVDDAVKKELDAVVADYAPPRSLRSTLLKWTGAAILAVAMAAIIAAIFHTHLTAAEKAPPPKRPVTIQIVPAR